MTEKTEIRFSLDRTGSMAAWPKPVVTAVNVYIEKLKDDRDGRKADLTLVQWDSMGFDVLRKGVVADIATIGLGEYKPRALTPLFDAVGAALTDNVKSDIRYILVIFTDGMENASKKYTSDSIRMLVEQRRKEGWTIIFLGANIDAWKVAEGMGIPPQTSMNVHVRGANIQRGGFFRGNINPVVAGLAAAAGLGLAYMLFNPTSAQAAPAFSDTDRNTAMGVDGVSKTWQDAVTEDVETFQEPLNSILDLPEELQQLHAELPPDFDPALGSMNEDGSQIGDHETIENNVDDRSARELTGADGNDERRDQVGDQGGESYSQDSSGDGGDGGSSGE